MRERNREQLLRVDVELRAEAAADVGRDDAELRLVHAERRCDEHAQDVRNLCRGVERHLAELARHGEHGAWLDRVRDQAWLDVAARDDDVRVVDRLSGRIGVEPPDVALVRAEVGMDERRAVRERLRHVDDRVPGVVVDLDELGSVLRLRARLGEDAPRCRRPGGAASR